MTEGSKPSVRLLITDLDNTLYDWVTFFATAFYEMVKVASELLNTPQEILLDDLRIVHQRFHNSEHPYSLLETRTVRCVYQGLSYADTADLLAPAFQRFTEVRNETLKLYPNVAPTLKRLHDLGVGIVGHTEATVPNALHRLKQLRIDQYLRRLYAVKPIGDSRPDPFQRSPSFETSLNVFYLNQDERKPDPRVLLDICRDEGISLTQALYVGDSIARDVGMAKNAGLWSAWAEYGTRFDRKLWERLVRVTHWTAEDVARAEAAEAKHHYVKPDVVLNQDFSEILDHFSFVGQERGGSDGSRGQ